jgi:hypothetical protein
MDGRPANPPGSTNVPATLVCVECRRDDDRRPGWKLRLADDGELVTYCPDCDAREFGTY